MSKKWSLVATIYGQYLARPHIYIFLQPLIIYLVLKQIFIDLFIYLFFQHFVFVILFMVISLKNVF